MNPISCIFSFLDKGIRFTEENGAPDAMDWEVAGRRAGERMRAPWQGWEQEALQRRTWETWQESRDELLLPFSKCLTAC